MTTKLKTRKPAAADLKKMATLDFEPWKENPAEALLWFNFEVINNPHLITCRLACTVMGRSKPELIEMIKKDDDGASLLMLGTLDDSIKFFKGVAELIEAARGRMLVALASCAEAPWALLRIHALVRAARVLLLVGRAAEYVRAAPCRKAGALADEATAWCDARGAAGKLAGPKST